MSDNGPHIFLSVGDPSADPHGAAVAAALRDRFPGARLYGLGGPRMAAAGVEVMDDFDRLNVMGFAEVVRHLPHFLRLLRDMAEELERRATDLLIPIDYPGFNLRLARSGYRAGIPVLYYIAPQAWAWHGSRARRLAEYVDRLAVVFPFEEAFFRERGAAARFVGHPLVDRPPVDSDLHSFCVRHGLDPDGRLLGLFPGSRGQEVDRHLPVFQDAAALLKARRPDLQPVIAAADGVGPERFEKAIWPVVRDSRRVLAHAHGALVKSGTSTIEAALAGVPMAVAYRAHPITFRIARRLVDVDHVAMANLVAGERLVPELLQDDATAEALVEALFPLLDAGPERNRVLEGLDRVRAALRPAEDGRTTAERVAELAAELLEASS